MKVLFVLTSHEDMGETGHKTGFWLEEFAAPYYVFKDAGAEITLASPKGGHPPLDPNSDAEEAQTDATVRFKQDPAAREHLSKTIPLKDIDLDDYDAVFYPGGHGPLWDLSQDERSVALIERAWEQGKIVSAVCHAPAIFRHTRDESGQPLVQGRRVTGFTNTEEEAVGLSEVVPFRVEDMLRDNGAEFSRAEDWAAHVVVDGRLITGQNPASSETTARAVLEALKG